MVWGMNKVLWNMYYKFIFIILIGKFGVVVILGGVVVVVFMVEKCIKLVMINYIFWLMWYVICMMV